MIGGVSTPRAAIKKAVLAIKLTKKEDRESSERGPHSSLPAVNTGRVLRSATGELDAAPGTQGLKGGTVTEQWKKRERLAKRSKGQSKSSHSLENVEDDDSDSSGSDSPKSEAKSEVKSIPGAQLGLEQLETPRSQVASPFGSGLAAMKVKHRLQALHQEAKKKPSQQSSTGTTLTTSSDLSVRNNVVEKSQEVPTGTQDAQKDAQQAAALAAANAAINAARTTLPNFSSPPDEAEEAEIMAMLGEVDGDLLSLVQEVQRILRWLFADGDTDFDGQLSHQELKAIFQRISQPLGSSLGMEVDLLTAHSEKNAHYSRARFIELFISVCVRVNQSPLLSSRLAEVKRFVRKGSSATGRALDAAGSGSAELLPEAKVSLLAGLPRFESSPSPQPSKWAFAKSAVRDMSERRQSREEMTPLKKLENLFASVKK